MNTQSSTGPSRSNRLIEFLGSMNLAITILVAIAIASVIGTVLQQNQAYTAYEQKFGPFWFQVFEFLGLYNVYSAPWFIVLMAFLIISTSVCVYRNAPHILRDMREYRLGIKISSLHLMKNCAEWQSDSDVSTLTEQFKQALQRQGYRLRHRDLDDGRLLAGISGVWNRPGYVLTHVGIIVLCIGGLLDSNIGLKLKEWRGEVEVAAWNMTGSRQAIPENARLSPSDTLSFRGAMSLPEGSMQNFAVLNIRDGFLVQDLPFAVELKDFRIEHYESGQPKSFESDVVIHDDELDKPLAKTIAVNHPLVYRGYALYQSDFDDGGSTLELRAWPFFSREVQSEPMSMVVNRSHTLKTTAGQRTLELEQFKVFNIFPNSEEAKAATGKKFRNWGPSFQYKLRDERGVAIEYQNYMLPVEQQGRLFFMSGIRHQPNQEFRFLYIPADSEGSLNRFMKFHALLHDEAKLTQIARESVAGTVQSQSMQMKPGFQDEVVASMMNLVKLFNSNGYIAIEKDIERKVPEEKRSQVAEAYLKVLLNVLQSAYYELLQQEGVNVNQTLSMQDSQFFEDAVTALAGIGSYASPFYLQLENFQHRESSVLQITRAPGQGIFYFGCVMLMLGVFMMFYISYQRVWLLLTPTENGTRVVLAGMGNRNLRDFAEKFSRLVTQMQQVSAKQ